MFHDKFGTVRKNNFWIEADLKKNSLHSTCSCTRQNISIA